MIMCNYACGFMSLRNMDLLDLVKGACKHGRYMTSEMRCASILEDDVYTNMNMMMRICLTLHHGSYCILDLLSLFYMKIVNKHN